MPVVIMIAWNTCRSRTHNRDSVIAVYMQHTHTHTRTHARTHTHTHTHTQLHVLTTRSRMTSVHSRHFFWGGGFSPPQKKLTIPPNGCQTVRSIFFGRDNESQIYRGNFLLMDNKHRKLLVIRQSKGCKFVPKMHQNTFGGRVPP